MLPPLSLLCPTYGRAKYLPEILQCFGECTYPGAIELLILNDAPEQSFTCDHGFGDLKQVRVINRTERYPSLGDKRNAAVSLARHEHSLFIDDDDIFLPWYPQDMMDDFLVWRKPTYTHTHFLLTGVGDALTCTYKNCTHPASYLATKSQFSAVGGYPFIYAGGDQVIRKKFFDMFGCDPRGHPKRRSRAGYMYRWGNGTYHISGSSDHATAWDRTHADLQHRLRSGDEPSGEVRLSPEWGADYLDHARRAAP